MSLAEALKSDRKILAVDLDDVIAHSRHLAIEAHNKYYGTSMSTRDLQYYSVDKCGWGHGDVLVEKCRRIFGSMERNEGVVPIAGAKEALMELKAMGWKLVIITGRIAEHLNATKDWVDLHFPGVFEDVIIAGYTTLPSGLMITAKVETIRQAGAVMIIDDRIETALECAAADPPIPSLLFGQYYWNRYEVLRDPESNRRDEEKLEKGLRWEADDVGQDLPDCVRRVKDWKEIVALFKQGGSPA